MSCGPLVLVYQPRGCRKRSLRKPGAGEDRGVGSAHALRDHDHNDDTRRPHVRQVAERLELIEAYDRLGFYACHLTEHHGTPLAVTPSPHLMLAAAAQRTSRLRLGTLITILSLYHPMRIIEEAVTLDQLSSGRLDLGVGRGVSAAELAFHGVSGEEEAQGRFDEAFAILRQGLTSDSVTFEGKYYKLLDVPGYLAPSAAAAPAAMVLRRRRNGVRGPACR